jgi:hypothetical protein
VINADDFKSQGCYWCSGKKINVTFYLKDKKEPDFSFTAATKNYAYLLDTELFQGNSNIKSLCLNELSYDERGNVCKIIKIGNVEGVFRNYVQHTTAGVPGFLGTEIIFNNKSNSIYSGLRFFLYLDVYKNSYEKWRKEDYWGKFEEIYPEALSYSKNIMEEKNLSKRDIDLLNDINQILSTFKFLK